MHVPRRRREKRARVATLCMADPVACPGVPSVASCALPSPCGRGVYPFPFACVRPVSSSSVPLRAGHQRQALAPARGAARVVARVVARRAVAPGLNGRRGGARVREAHQRGGVRVRGARSALGVHAALCAPAAAFTPRPPSRQVDRRAASISNAINNMLSPEGAGRRWPVRARWSVSQPCADAAARRPLCGGCARGGALPDDSDAGAGDDCEVHAVQVEGGEQARRCQARGEPGAAPR